MKHFQLREQHGQVLVQVALAMIFLLLFVGLAIDGGSVYAARRRMQNAADAAALAGAWEICFGDAGNIAQVVGQAEHYGKVENGADELLVDTDGINEGLVRVTVIQHVRTGFIGLLSMLGIGDWDEIDVPATAAARCAKADSGCGLWPLAYPKANFEAMGDGEVLYVWNDNQANEVDPTKCGCVVKNISTGVDDPSKVDINVCTPIPTLSNEDRGWVLMPWPKDEYKDPGECKGKNCGQQTKCYLEHGYYGLIEASSSNPICLPGNAGKVQAAVDAANTRAGEYMNIMLWDRACNQAGDPEKTGECDGNLYRVVGLGCVKILGAATINIEGSPGQGCKNNVEVILAIKAPANSCATACGSTSGDDAGAGDVRAVSLVE
ncbi:MAG: pilus assembly protein TadG-related protein [Anaerolineae bacterium]|jgi:hypothetical protein